MPYPVDTLLKIRNRSLNTVGGLKSSQFIQSQFVGFLTDVYRKIGLLLLVYSGQRNYPEQWELRKEYLAGGNIAASPGGSWHAYGRAVDVVPVWYDGSLNWEMNPSGWKRIADIAAGWGLKSGASFGDPGHFKYTAGASLVQLRNANPGWEQYKELEEKMKQKKIPWRMIALFAGLGGIAIFTYNKNRK